MKIDSLAFDAVTVHLNRASGAHPGPTRKASLMRRASMQLSLLASSIFFVSVAYAGSYTESGVNGYIGPDRRHADPISDPNATVNPLFRGWATGFKDYLPADVNCLDGWCDPNKALGPATGENFDIVSLGELDAVMIGDGCQPGQIALLFGDPCDGNDPNHIRNVEGYDFVVFENGFVSDWDTVGGSVWGQMLAELAFVEVSTDGNDFVRFGSVSLTSEPTGKYGTLEISDVYSLAGKHPNAYGICTGTPFDLSTLTDNPLVVSGAVDLNDIRYVRIVDIPGSGDYVDLAVQHTDPCTWPGWANYDSNHPVYDAWVTTGSGGFDLEAVGVLNEQQYSADINLDGMVDWADYVLFASAWQDHFGSDGWIGRCDLSEPKDMEIDMKDLAVFVDQWLETEQWRN